MDNGNTHYVIDVIALTDLGKFVWGGRTKFPKYRKLRAKPESRARSVRESRAKQRACSHSCKNPYLMIEMRNTVILLKNED